eukprot:TRINITY_DN17603_c0_g1_i1.p1 TRINITY_DN17603_c0_g1~~TRINITY_DN17603_c0_g1_i1.p1  ORF type:complete len:149 (+),score=6.47 TRINITY_DN17603_c0_g1_i1:62-508(+)
MDDNAYTGTCACGRVTIHVDKDCIPPLSVWCHCNDCTRHNMAPVVGAMGFAATDLNTKIRVEGKEHLKQYQTTERITRHFCSNCGSPCYMDLHAAKMTAIYSRFLDSFPFKPTSHFHYSSKRISIKDGLPKWKDGPSEYGGSGIALEE